MRDDERIESSTPTARRRKRPPGITRGSLRFQTHYGSSTLKIPERCMHHDPSFGGTSLRRSGIRLARSTAGRPAEAREIMVRFHGQAFHWQVAQWGERPIVNRDDAGSTPALPAIIRAAIGLLVGPPLLPAVDTVLMNSMYYHTPAMNHLIASPFTSRTGATSSMSSHRTTNPAMAMKVVVAETASALLTQSRLRGWSVSRLDGSAHAGCAHAGCGSDRSKMGANDFTDAGGTRMPC